MNSGRARSCSGIPSGRTPAPAPQTALRRARRARPRLLGPRGHRRGDHGQHRQDHVGFHAANVLTHDPSTKCLETMVPTFPRTVIESPTARPALSTASTLRSTAAYAAGSSTHTRSSATGSSPRTVPIRGPDDEDQRIGSFQERVRLDLEPCRTPCPALGRVGWWRRSASALQRRARRSSGRPRSRECRVESRGPTFRAPGS